MRPLALLLALVACSADVAPTTPRLPHSPTLAVAPVGTNAIVTACGGKVAIVTVTWAVVSSDATYVTAYVYDQGRFVDGSGRIAPYSAGQLSMVVPFGATTIQVYNWSPDGGTGLTKSAPTTLSLDLTRKDCP